MILKTRMRSQAEFLEATKNSESPTKRSKDKRITKEDGALSNDQPVKYSRILH